MDFEHNKSKRRRLNKKMALIMRNPRKRELLIRHLAMQNTPLRSMPPKYIHDEVK